MIDVIHVGFPKCASTFIQEAFLNSVEDLNYIDLHYCIENFQEDDAFYDSDFFQQTMEKQADKNKINVASSEYIVNYFLHWTRSFDRLAELYPNARILLVIRNQKDFMSSYFQERIRGGGGYAFDNFVKDFCRRNGALNACKYSQVIDKLKQTFPEVRVELFETMFADKEMTDLCQFLGSKKVYQAEGKKVNAKYSPLSHFFTLLVNRFQPTKIQGFKSYMAQEYFGLMASTIDKIVNKVFPRWKIKVPKEMEEYINEFYAEDNANLQKYFKEDIRKLGYYYEEKK